MPCCAARSLLCRAVQVVPQLSTLLSGLSQRLPSSLQQALGGQGGGGGPPLPSELAVNGRRYKVLRTVGTAVQAGVDLFGLCVDCWIGTGTLGVGRLALPGSQAGGQAARHQACTVRGHLRDALCSVG